MKLGLMSTAFPSWPLQRVAEWAGSNGFDMLEIACWPPSKADRRYAGVTHIDVSRLDGTQAGQIRGMLHRYGLHISSLGYYPNPLHPDPEHRRRVIEHLHNVIRAAEMLQVPVVGTFVGRDKDRGVEENFVQFEQVWPPIVAYAEAHGVKIAIENCPMLFSDDEWPGGCNLAVSPVIWRQMWQAIPSPAFGLNLDPSHLVWQSIDYLRAVHEFAGRILHVHAKDMHVDPEGLYQRGVLSLGMGWQVPRLPGRGDVNWAGFISALKGAGYEGVVSIEHEDRAYEGTEELVEQGFLLARDVLRPHIG